MLRPTLVVLAIGAVVAGLAPIAHAQSGRSSSSDNSSVTLSGDSLRTIEKRSINNDFPNFFNGGNGGRPQVSRDNSQTNVGRITQSQQTGSLNEGVDVVFGDTLNRQTTLTAFPSAGDRGDNERVRVQLELGK
jgi:hypothetical protein